MMKRFAIPVLVGASFAFAACGGGDADDDDDDDQDAAPADAAAPDAPPFCDPEAAEPCNPGFLLPDEATHAWTQDGITWTDQGLADWSCLGTPGTDVPLAVETLTITGTVADFQDGDPTVGGTVTVFPAINVAAAALATAVTDAKGGYSVTVPVAAIPVGTTRLGFRVEADKTLPTLLLNQYFAPDVAEQTRGLNSVSNSTADTISAFIGVVRSLSRGVLAGEMRDCQDRSVSSAIVTVSSASGQVVHVPAAQTYYFSNGENPVPLRLTTRTVTNTNGLFVVLELEPTESAFMQVWGYTDEARRELTLLAELAVPVLADTVITASIDPLRSAP